MCRQCIVCVVIELCIYAMLIYVYIYIYMNIQLCSKVNTVNVI